MEDTSARTSPDALPVSEQATPDPHQTPQAPETGAAPMAASVDTDSTPATDVDAAAAEAAAPVQSEQTVEADDTQSDASEEHEQEAADTADEASASAEGGTPGKRKRRRRRKRKDGAAHAQSGTASGDVAAPGVEGESSQKKKESSHAPFAHRFAGAAGTKRHAFAVGEVVAGRVQSVDHGVIVVDLFGKATAMADEYEPREVPVLPEPPEVPVEAAAETSEEVSQLGNEQAASEQAASEVSEPLATEETSVATAPAEPSGERVEADVPAIQATGPESESEEAPAPYVATEQLSETAAPALEPQASEASAPAAEAADVSEAVGVGEAAAVSAPAEPEPPTPEPSSSDETQAASADETTAHDQDHDHDHDHDHDEAVVSVEPEREKPPLPAIGQVFKGRVGAVSESGHIAILNRIVDSKAVRAQLALFREQHKRVHGMVYGYNRGGFDVLVEGVRAFCPASAMSLEDIAEPLEFVGKKLEFLLPASKAGSKDIIVSRRSILERLQRRKTKEFLRGLTPGQRFKGKVTAVRDFGLFVDIGGVEGLVHQSELSYAFGVKPSSVAKVGDEIEVQVLRVGGEPKRDKEGGGSKRDRLTRVSLSVKALLPDPWDAHAEALTEGAIHKGKVVRAAEFGAFIEVAPEVEGLLHITELGRDLKHANLAVQEGDDIYVAVERVDRKARRISLSKLSPAEVQDFEAGKLTRDDTAARNLRQGNTVKVKIERIEPRCVFGRVTGTVGRRGRVFIPSSETGTERGSDLRKSFPIGTEIEAKIIGTDRDGSLKCSVKAMQIDEERQAVKNYRREAAKQGFGTFGDLLRAKLGEAQK